MTSYIPPWKQTPEQLAAMAEELGVTVEYLLSIKPKGATSEKGGITVADKVDDFLEKNRKRRRQV